MDSEKTKFCTPCGEKIQKDAVVRTKCGKQIDKIKLQTVVLEI